MEIDAVPASAPKIAKAHRSVAVLGDAGDPGAWSGIPYHFYKAGVETGFFDSALDLGLDGVRLRRVTWNLGRLLSGDRPGGFQYSRECLERLFSTSLPRISGNELVSHFQLFPPPRPASAAGVRWGHYIDMPLHPLFDDYGEASKIGRRIKNEALDLERQTYAGAHRVVCMSKWAAEAVRRHCGVDGAKVKIVLPGANLDEEMVERLTGDLDAAPIDADFKTRPFRLGFTGKHPERKGFRRLVGAAEILDRRGHAVEVRAIGEVPRDLRSHRLVRALGFIDKKSEMTRFINEISRFDLGCLPSHAEALGISTLECLRVGVPVLGTDAGGIPDTIPANAGILIDQQASPQAIADALEPVIVDAARYARLRNEARRVRHHYSWTRVVREFEKAWN
jgi:glycosyltransferase involved in cell wall biosynthesis